MDSINVNLDNLTQSEREQLMTLIEKSNTKFKAWKPEYGKEYWVITRTGNFEKFEWDNDTTDQSYYTVGNCYSSKEDAGFAFEKQKILVELQRYADEHNEGEFDWGDGSENKYYIFYDHSEQRLGIYPNQFLQSNATYFTSREIAFDAIQTVGEDHIKKYLFNIF